MGSEEWGVGVVLWVERGGMRKKVRFALSGRGAGTLMVGEQTHNHTAGRQPRQSHSKQTWNVEETEMPKLDITE